MKKNFHPKFPAAWLIPLATAAVVACTNDATPTPPPTDDVNQPVEQIAAEPFKSVKATIGEETVTAIVDKEDKTLSLTFDYAETFEAVDLAVELNDGWAIASPAEPDNADLSGEDPQIVFQSADDTTLSYAFQLKSYAFPIADPSKITIDGATLEANAQDPFRFTIHFESNASTSVVLHFAQGALMEGASIAGLENGTLTLEFGSLTTQQIEVTANGKAHPYTFVLDMPEKVDEFLQKLLTVGNFVDKTAEYAFASKYDYIKVYNATELKNMPGATNGKGEDGSSTSEPVHWMNNSSLEVQEAAMRCLGDCTEADFTQTVGNVNFTVVAVDKSKVRGRIMASGEDLGFSIDGSEGLIAMSGNVVVREDQQFRNNLIAVDGTTMANHLSWLNNNLFRTAIAFDSDGDMHFVLAGLDTSDNSIRQLPFCEDQTNHGAVLDDAERDKYYYGANYASRFLPSWNFDMKSVATAHMLVILDGEAKGWRWGLLNDGNSSQPGNATAYNARARRTFIGETPDKIIFVTETGDGVLISQGGRVMQVVGCTNATATSRHDGWMNVSVNGRSTEYVPMLYIDGENVAGGAENTCPLCYKIVYDIR